MEKISVIIPTYNRGSLITKSINSVLDQTHPAAEIIIIDDCSNDNTEQVIAQIQDPRIKYYKNSANMGAAASRNRGVSLATCPFVAFQDSDDYWHPDKLEVQMNYWQKNPQYHMIYCPYYLHRKDGSTFKIPYADTFEDLETNIRRTLLLNNTAGTPTILIRKESFLSIGGFDTSLSALEDWDMVLRFSEKYQIGYVDSVLVDAYLQTDGISSQIGAFYNSRCQMIASNKNALIEEGLLESALSQLLEHASSHNVLEAVKQMLSIYLTAT